MIPNALGTPWKALSFSRCDCGDYLVGEKTALGSYLGLETGVTIAFSLPIAPQLQPPTSNSNATQRDLDIPVRNAYVWR